MRRILKAALLGAIAMVLVTPASHATAILVGQCIEFTTCTSAQTPTPWSDSLSTANLTSLGLGTSQPLVAAQTGAGIIRLGVTTIDFLTTTGAVVESLPEFSGLAGHPDPCNFCEIDTVGTFSIPANAVSATVSGFFGNSVVPNSAGVDVCLGSGVPCAATVPAPPLGAPTPLNLALLGGVFGLFYLTRRADGRGRRA
jgi:hypothetical protein